MVEISPVVRGKWKLYSNDDDSGMSYWCTVCNFQLSEDLFYSGYKNGRWIENGVFKYCPNCGAKMEVEQGQFDSIILNELIPRCTPKAAELLKRGLLGAIKVCAVNECVHVQKNKQREEL